MRAHHAIAIAAVILVGFGVKLFFSSAPTAGADIRAGKGVSIDIAKMHENKNLPEQAMHDMTFVFSHGD
jgi:hypothetical protein